jgi:hypothetical protein
MYFQIMAANSKLQRFRTALDRYLVVCLPAIALFAFLGATVCILQMFRSVLGYVQYDRSAPSLLINFAFVMFLGWAEARWFIASTGPCLRQLTAKSALQRVAGWLSSIGWILFLAADRYADWHRSKFTGSVLQHMAEIPHGHLVTNARLVALGLVFSSVAIAVNQLHRARPQEE